MRFQMKTALFVKFSKYNCASILSFAVDNEEDIVLTDDDNDEVDVSVASFVSVPVLRVLDVQNILLLCCKLKILHEYVLIGS